MDVVPPTLRQIAQRAGVDRSTVSLALRNDLRLLPTTRRRIQKLATKMGYRKNPTVARLMTQLRIGQKAHFHSNLGFIDFSQSPLHPTDPLHPSHPVIAGATSRARVLGYGLEVFQAAKWNPKRLEEIMLSRGIRGLLFGGLHGRNSLSEEYQILCRNFPHCVCGMHTDNPSLNFVTDDHYLTAMTAVRKLRQLGFTKIGLALHAGINLETEYRFMGGYYMAHMESPILRHPPVLLLEPDDRKKFLAWFQPKKIEVIVCIQKEILTWLRGARYRVPTDVSLIHLDLEPAGIGWAGMRQRNELCGARAVEMLVNQINHGQVGLDTICQGVLIESAWEFGGTLALPGRKSPAQNRPGFQRVNK